MPKLCYSVACSLDGFIAGPNGEADWIALDPEVDFAALWARFDTLLMGRRTFEAAVKRFGGVAGFQGKKVLVASRSWGGVGPEGVTVMSQLDVETVSRVRAEASRGIWLMGGGELFGFLLDAGEVDEVDLMVVPVLLGAGVPLAGRLAKRAELVLSEHRAYPSGLLALRYTVQRG